MGEELGERIWGKKRDKRSFLNKPTARALVTLEKSRHIGAFVGRYCPRTMQMHLKHVSINKGCSLESSRLTNLDTLSN